MPRVPAAVMIVIAMKVQGAMAVSAVVVGAVVVMVIGHVNL
jgi:hypothetical protein